MSGSEDWRAIADALPPASPDEDVWLAGFRRLVRIMARLRDPEQGCPWDREQDFSSIAPYTIEEAYEVADAIAREDWDELAAELGDLALQVVFHARMAEEARLFHLGTVLDAIVAKMIRRHPHVFGKAERPADAAAQTAAWERLKEAERREKAKDASGADSSVLGAIPRDLPPLRRALALQKAAARLGFDWPQAQGVLAKLDEEIAELKAVLRDDGGKSDPRQEAVREEVGDLLFTLVNLARHLGIDPEMALMEANAKFARRFRTVERRLAREPHSRTDIDRLESWWQDAKKAEQEQNGA
ncbi:MAG: nucleoside triphosphate pyrophosphohydrolase [Alphaproteobacteria bacterium]|nr:MAG: nucleoside triphosphate pyrophosphohydrolase [Alphaproteobacteria bacterium]